MQLSQENKTPSVQASQDYSTRIFLFALELIPYFALPAILGFFLQKRFVASNPDSTFLITVGIFSTTYILSWAIVYLRYSSIKRKYQK
jgi:hypothetical protein